MATFPKKLHIKTFGCQMNVYDSERMAEALARRTATRRRDAAEADLVMLNTCHIREKAAEKVYSELGRLRALKAGRATRGGHRYAASPSPVAWRRPKAGDFRRAPARRSRRRPAELSSAARSGRAARCEAGERAASPPTSRRTTSSSICRERPRTRGRPSAFITVQEGCDKFCTFCVVPYTRGAEYSRPVADILAEARAARAGGVRELTLLGQNVNAYHGEGPDGKDWRWRSSCGASPSRRRSPGCATPRATRATWTTS